MKKKLPILLIIIAIVISLIILIPSQISANECDALPGMDEIEEQLTIDVDKGSASSPTEIEVCATDAPDGMWPYAFVIVKYSGSIEEFNCEPSPEDFVVYVDEGYFDIEGGVPDCDSFEVELGNGHYYAFVFVFEGNGNSIETTGAGVGYYQVIPPDSITSIAQNDHELDELVAWNFKKFTIGETKTPEPEPEPEPLVRDDEMVCYQVWVNDDSCFEFVFWYEYKDNNHVKIYDMEGNLVYETDMEYGNARIEVCLPDGLYKVMTYHDQPEPLQEFYIGKPVL
jgi:hypothetical protein